ncbi:hypothetical protein WA158_001195 [Blastocystis sp. Blastoise]
MEIETVQKPDVDIDMKNNSQEETFYDVSETQNDTAPQETEEEQRKNPEVIQSLKQIAAIAYEIDKLEYNFDRLCNRYTNNWAFIYYLIWKSRSLKKEFLSSVKLMISSYNYDCGMVGENATHQLLKLDGVESNGHQLIKTERKSLVHRIDFLIKCSSMLHSKTSEMKSYVLKMIDTLNNLYAPHIMESTSNSLPEMNPIYNPLKRTDSIHTPRSIPIPMPMSSSESSPMTPMTPMMGSYGYPDVNVNMNKQKKNKKNRKGKGRKIVVTGPEDKKKQENKQQQKEEKEKSVSKPESPKQSSRKDSKSIPEATIEEPTHDTDIDMNINNKENPIVEAQPELKQSKENKMEIEEENDNKKQEEEKESKHMEKTSNTVQGNPMSNELPKSHYTPFIPTTNTNSSKPAKQEKNQYTNDTNTDEEDNNSINDEGFEQDPNAYKPQYKWIRKADNAYLLVNVPNAEPDSLQIEKVKNAIHISGKRYVVDDQDTIYRRFFGSYTPQYISKSFDTKIPIEKTIELSKPRDASYKEGVITILFKILDIKQKPTPKPTPRPQYGYYNPYNYGYMNPYTQEEEDDDNDDDNNTQQSTPYYNRSRPNYPSPYGYDDEDDDDDSSNYNPYMRSYDPYGYSAPRRTYRNPNNYGMPSLFGNYF